MKAIPSTPYETDEYMNCITDTSKEFADQGLLTHTERAETISMAPRAGVGLVDGLPLARGGLSPRTSDAVIAAPRRSQP